MTAWPEIGPAHPDRISEYVVASVSLGSRADVWPMGRTARDNGVVGERKGDRTGERRDEPARALVARVEAEQSSDEPSEE